MNSTTIAAELAEGAILKRPDGRIVLLETRLPDGDWGCDMLENVDGYPDPLGDPGCYCLKVPAEVLATYKQVK